MSAEDCAPCRHSGAPAESVVDRVIEAIAELADDPSHLSKYGLSRDEYLGALPAAIERFRGRGAASTSRRRIFLRSILDSMLSRGLVSSIELPSYGDDTVYRLKIPDFGDVAIIQKGCPDGAHSSRNWSTPDWARESYLWWICPSLNQHPGEHVFKGLLRLRARFFSEVRGELDGVIFHNELCGTPQRPCPKMSKAIQIDDALVPPPCVYVLPRRADGPTEWNWDGSREVHFPTRLLQLFEIYVDAAPSYVGYVGHRRRGDDFSTIATSRFGYGRSTTHRR